MALKSFFEKHGFVNATDVADIEDVKNILGFAISTREKYQKLAADGFTWTDGLQFAPDLLRLPSIIDSAKDLPQVFTNLTEEQADELVIWFSEEFDLEADKTEKLIEDAFEWLLATFIFWKSVV